MWPVGVLILPWVWMTYILEVSIAASPFIGGAAWWAAKVRGRNPALYAAWGVIYTCCMLYPGILLLERLLVQMKPTGIYGVVWFISGILPYIALVIMLPSLIFSVALIPAALGLGAPGFPPAFILFSMVYLASLVILVVFRKKGQSKPPVFFLPPYLPEVLPFALGTVNFLVFMLFFAPSPLTAFITTFIANFIERVTGLNFITAGATSL